MWVLRERVCTLCRGYDTGDLGTDSGDHTTVLTDGFHVSTVGHHKGPHAVSRPLQMGAADGTVTSLDSQGFRMVTHKTRTP